MKLNELSYNKGAKRESKRVGRGPGSGLGKNAGTGNKGQNSRSGGGVRLGFEGGQNPIYRRIPKFGFTNPTRKEYAIVNISSLNKFKDGTVVNSALLIDSGLVKKEYDGIKILGNGILERKLTVVANKFSKSAQKAIEGCGGKVEVV